MKNVNMKTMALLLAGLLLWFAAAPAMAEGDGGDQDENKSGDGAVGANVNYFLTNPPLNGGQGGVGEEGYDETFYFGAGEEQIWLQKIEKNRYQDRSGEASRAMKRVIGYTLITSGTVMMVWGAFFHYETKLPTNYVNDYRKYEDMGISPLVTTNPIYWPSMVAGAGLTAGAFWLMNKK